MNQKIKNYKLEYISCSDNEILFVERVEDSLVSIDRKNY